MFRLSTYLANTDEDMEGNWTNMYNKSISTSYLSWMPNRPYAGKCGGGEWILG